jgi:hypothetical protein
MPYLTIFRVATLRPADEIAGEAFDPCHSACNIDPVFERRLTRSSKVSVSSIFVRGDGEWIIVAQFVDRQGN